MHSMFTKSQKQMYQPIMSYLLFRMYLFGPVLVNLERKEITRNNWLGISSSVPKKTKAPISRKQRGCTCTLAQCYHFSLIHYRCISKIKRGNICSQNRAYDPALSDDTLLNLSEKTINCTQYYGKTNMKNILERKTSFKRK